LEAEELASCFLAFLAWDIEKDRLAWLSVEPAVEAVTLAEGRAFTWAEEPMLHLSEMLAKEMVWERMCALTAGRLEARSRAYLNGELYWRW
jgi:hypothetical protein